MQITLSAIHQSYGSQPLFRGLDLTMPSGSLFTLLGPSGCGKTTLLRMLAGFVRPDTGRVLFGPEDVTDIPVHKRNVGMVFQDYALFPDRSVLANTCYGLLARGMSKAQATGPALEMLRRVGLHEYADRAPAELSGGQRQRVAMARALVIRPRLLLLDEPLSALDAKLRIELRAMIRELQRELGITTVFVTHDQEEALSLSDYIAVMDRGRIVQMGSPQEIYNQPATSFVADFVGGANLIPIQNELTWGQAGLRRFSTAAGTLAVRMEGPLPERPVLLVRAEALQLHAGRLPLDNEITGQIELVEYYGSTTAYTLRSSFGVLRAEVSSRSGERLWKQGDHVLARVSETSIVVPQ